MRLYYVPVVPRTTAQGLVQQYEYDRRVIDVWHTRTAPHGIAVRV